MNVTLANNLLAASISDTGAEIKSLREVDTGVEYIWQGDPAWWTGSAPVLFPIVGGLKGGAYRLDGLTYEMPQHGFVRKKPWLLAKFDETSATFRTESEDAYRVKGGDLAGDVFCGCFEGGVAVEQRHSRSPAVDGA